MSHDPPDDNWPLHWGETDARELRVLLGNDVYGDAPFHGTISRAVLRSADQSVDLLDEDLVSMPASYWRLPRSLQDPFWAWGGMTPDLYVMGALWFAVLVAMFGRTFARRRFRGHRARAFVAGAALAAFTELGQLVFDGREVAWIDVITAWLGCVLGLGLLALRATSRADRGELDIAPPPHAERAPR